MLWTLLLHWISFFERHKHKRKLQCHRRDNAMIMVKVFSKHTRKNVFKKKKKAYFSLLLTSVGLAVCSKSAARTYFCYIQTQERCYRSSHIANTTKANIQIYFKKVGLEKWYHSCKCLLVRKWRSKHIRAEKFYTPRFYNKTENNTSHSFS